MSAAGRWGWIGRSRVASNGGRYQFEDDWETPDTQVIGWDFAERKSIAWEGRSCNDYPVEGLARGAMVYGTEGAVLLDGNSYTIFDKNKKVVKEIKEKAAVDPTNIFSGTGMRAGPVALPELRRGHPHRRAAQFADRGRAQERDDAAPGQHRVAGRP